MAKKQLNPTRMELNIRKKKLVTMRRGHKLLKDKRDELMRQFLELIKRNRELRKSVSDSLYKANMYFTLCRCEMSDEEINTSLLYSNNKLKFTTDTVKIMSVSLPSFNIDDNIFTEKLPYSFGFTSYFLDLAIEEINKLTPIFLELCQVEQSCYILSKELEKTRRRVNALEHFLIPDTLEEIKFIKIKLDENQLSTQVRLMKVKDMMLKETHNYKY